MKPRTALTRPGFLASYILVAASAFAQQTQPCVIKDVEYARAGGISLRLDLYLPEGQGPHPLIVRIHGGAFRSGDKGGIFWSPMPRQTDVGGESVKELEDLAMGNPAESCGVREVHFFGTRGDGAAKQLRFR